MKKKRTTAQFRKKKKSLFFLPFLVFFLGLIFVASIAHLSEARSFEPKSLRAIVQRHFRPVCGTLFNAMARCNAHIVTQDTSTTPLGSTSPLSSSYGPAQFHTAYNLPCTPGGNVQAVCGQPTSFGGQTIAIIDAYYDPTIESDLQTYDSNYGLPSCTQANGCLTIVNENGGTTLPSKVDGGWALETSLDVEVAHMTCQTCKILLVEANASYYSDLGTAVNTAAKMGATEISNSYGGSEWSGETSYDSAYYNHPGIAVTASNGDSGYGAEFPAASPNVVATGGTTLQVNTDNTYGTESIWNGTGSGCSSFEPADSWQTSLGNWNQTFCGAGRAIGDVSADADPNTGAAVYDSTPYNGSTGWYQVGGTSLASPLIAGVYALAGGVPANTNATSIPYARFTSANFHNVTTGSNGTCGTIMCNGAAGYNGPSGLGTPDGYSGFGSSTILPTPTSSLPTPTLSAPSATPTVTPTPTIPSTQTLTFGYLSIGNRIDSRDSNRIEGSRFRMGATGGTLHSISVYVASVQNAPNNQYQVGIYLDNNGRPGMLLARSASGTLVANNWNTLTVSVPLTANAYYWLVYNTNATSNSLNDLRYASVSSRMGMHSSGSVTYGSWPTNFSSSLNFNEYSIYATYTTP